MIEKNIKQQNKIERNIFHCRLFFLIISCENTNENEIRNQESKVACHICHEG